MEALFSYGTLQLDHVQLRQFGRLLDGTDDVLHGYVVTEIQIRDPAVLDASGIDTHRALVPGDGPPIAGKVFQLTPEELEAADVYEHENYVRVRVALASGTRAWVYVRA
ncbi:gamma-glutamylcyclotransferase family protein [Sphingomonas pituitosa]|uniref:gamma-glutamylcyclotransferase family protein n=1 Tax=Sphingomonas pituitosa TaxID=99597 RepID=UPI00082F8887|nr:gamma-glutamylcyclotransferase family protein [Sphingomonas pituitosa]